MSCDHYYSEEEIKGMLDTAKETNAVVHIRGHMYEAKCMVCKGKYTYCLKCKHKGYMYICAECEFKYIKPLYVNDDKSEASK